METQTEEWKDIVGFEGGYMVSNLGRVKRCVGVRCRQEKILKQTFRNGYKSVGMRYNGKHRTCFVHRLIADAFIPNPDNKPQINHINSRKSDNRIENLEWVTHQENITHSYTHPTRKRLINQQLKSYWKEWRIKQDEINCIEKERLIQKAFKAIEDYWKYEFNSASACEKQTI